MYPYFDPKPQLLKPVHNHIRLHVDRIWIWIINQSKSILNNPKSSISIFCQVYKSIKKIEILNFMRLTRLGLVSKVLGTPEDTQITTKTIIYVDFNRLGDLLGSEMNNLTCMSNLNRLKAK